jgi:uncharacterized protein YdeI (YjbR/CyaY-like superfamily)
VILAGEVVDLTFAARAYCRRGAEILRDSAGLPRLARGASRGRGRAARRLLQEGHRYSIRFTPRRVRSIWSAVNIKRAGELIAEGRMTPAGLAAFEARDEDRSAIYSYEQRHAAKLDAEQEARLRADPAAWEWFQSRPPSWRRAAVYWVTSAKKPETRERRLATLIEDAAAGRMPKALTPPG